MKAHTIHWEGVQAQGEPLHEKLTAYTTKRPLTWRIIRFSAGECAPADVTGVGVFGFLRAVKRTGCLLAWVGGAGCNEAPDTLPIGRYYQIWKGNCRPDPLPHPPLRPTLPWWRFSEPHTMSILLHSTFRPYQEQKTYPRLVARLFFGNVAFRPRQGRLGQPAGEPRRLRCRHQIPLARSHQVVQGILRLKEKPVVNPIGRFAAGLQSCNFLEINLRSGDKFSGFGTVLEPGIRSAENDSKNSVPHQTR